MSDSFAPVNLGVAPDGTVTGFLQLSFDAGLLLDYRTVNYSTPGFGVFDGEGTASDGTPLASKGGLWLCEVRHNGIAIAGGLGLASVGKPEAGSIRSYGWLVTKSLWDHTTVNFLIANGGQSGLIVQTAGAALGPPVICHFFRIAA